MIKIRQKHLNVPGEQVGDCWRACIASILECGVGVFPDPNDFSDEPWSVYHDEVVKVLNSRGYKLDAYTVESVEQGELNAEYLIAVGTSPRSTDLNALNHAVVWRDGVAHDPHPDQTGIIDVKLFEILRPIEQEVIKLSKKNLAVLELMAKDYRFKEICNELDIKQPACGQRMIKLRQAFKCGSNSGMIVKAIKLNIIHI